MEDKDLTILVVDDDATTRRIEKKLLNQLGYVNIIEAEDGVIAMGILQKGDVGCILSDWDMPNMNGMELLQKVRADEKLQDLPFIMITANDTRENIITAVKSKVNQYIVKPFTAQSLGEKLHKVLNG